MKIAVDIQALNGRYHAQVSTPAFSAVEEEQMRNFGEPLVEVGGDFSGTVTRPGQTSTTLEVIGISSSPAAITPVLTNGVITGATITDKGMGYPAAAILVHGDGQGASLSPMFGIQSEIMLAAGENYAEDDELSYNPTGASQPVTIRVTAVDSYGLYGVINTNIAAGGTGYLVDELLSYFPEGSREPVILKVATIDEVTGEVTSFSIVSPGEVLAMPDLPVSTWDGSAGGQGFTVAVDSFEETATGSNGNVLAYEIVTEGQVLAVPAQPLGANDEWVTTSMGSGFTIPTLVWGITNVVINNGGSGYNTVPVTAAFTLPTAARRLRSDFPVKMVFDLLDYDDADVRAKVWADTVVARATAAKQALLRRETPLEGETVTTV